MGRQKRKFKTGLVIHCYQRTAGGFIIFYTVNDYVVFFTRFCIVAARYNVRVLKICLMYDHIHVSVIAPDRETLSAFVRDYTSKFSREYNMYWGLGSIDFCSPFGSAVKWDSKAIRTNLIYVDNNPVERHIVNRAEDYRWNFLAYAKSNHPFSDKLSLSSASITLRRDLKMIDAYFNCGKHISYKTMSKLLHGLDNTESDQLVDYIISKYNIIDYQYSERLFGSLDNMLLALHSTTGSEYDINEIKTGKSDELYPILTKNLLRDPKIRDIHDIFSYSDEEKMYLVQKLYSRTAFDPIQIGKYLHLILKRP